ncbi:MAG: bis-aminopropyl spermidine synthase family protein [Sandaracinaceae bacterium]
MNAYLAALNRKYRSIKPPPDRRLEQYAVDVGGVFLRARLIAEMVRRGRGLLVGDDDLLSLYLAGYEGLPLTVLEKDARIRAAISDNLPDGADTTLVEADFSGIYDDMWPPFEGRVDFFATSPPYTPEGMTLFVAIGLRHLEVGGLGFIAAPHDASHRADQVTQHVQRFALANGALIERVIPAMTTEEGLPAYQIVVRKLADVDAFDWVRPLQRTLYEYQEYGVEDAYAHQSENG